jgi:transcriptional regulator with XRE-family HTH domain
MKNTDTPSKPLPNSRLKRERELRGWSQADLAEKVRCDTKTVGRWESGDSIPRPYHRQALCEIFKKNAQELGLIGEDVLSPSLHPGETPPGESLKTPIDYKLAADSSSSEDTGGRATSSEFDRSQPRQQNTSRSPQTRRTALAALIVWAMLISFAGVNAYLSASRHIKPGGGWISPFNGQVVSEVVHFAAYAYPTHPKEPLIDHVNFTVWWQGVDLRIWKVACTATPPASNDVFSCNTDLRLLGAVAGPIRVSFDVYDQAGNANLAPNGEHTITYAP